MKNHQEDRPKTPDSFPEKECTRVPWSLVKQKGNTIVVTPLKCKCWHCDVCGPNRKKQLQFQARLGNPNKFITLTASNESGSTPDAKAQALRSAWRTVRRRARKEFYTGKIEFLAVFETTENDQPHLHILARTRYIPQKWLSRQMASLTSSPIVDIRAVKSKRQAAYYVTKYISKAPDKYEGCKRYWRSLDYIAPKGSPTTEPGEFPNIYYLVRSRPAEAQHYLSKHGWSIISQDNDPHLVWTDPDPPPIRPGHTACVTWDPKDSQYRS